MGWFADYVRHGGRVHHDEPAAATLHRAWSRTKPGRDRDYFERAIRQLATGADKGAPRGWFWWARLGFEAACLGTLAWMAVRWLLP
jgi:hypothetical protein